MSVGENLSIYINLDHVSSKTLNGLQVELRKIRIPYKIISMYHDGKSHVAWVNLSRKLRKRQTIKE